MKRQYFGTPATGANKVPCVSKKFPPLRAPPQRRLMPKAFSTMPTVGSSPFEKLPSEIRNDIYKMVLVDEAKPLEIRYRHDSDSPAMTHALLHVSRSIRAECSKMYYGSNTFVFRSVQDLELFLATCGDSDFVKNVVLSEGVLQGYRHCSLRLWTPRSTTHRAFTYRISKGVAPRFWRQRVKNQGRSEDKDEIQKFTEDRALEKLGRINELMSESVKQDLVIEGMIPHCEACANGNLWDCGQDMW